MQDEISQVFTNFFTKTLNFGGRGFQEIAGTRARATGCRWPRGDFSLPALGR